MRSTICVALAISGLGLWGAGSDWERWSLHEEDTIQKTLPLTDSPMRLVVDNVQGYVHVTGSSGSQVEVTARRTIRAETQSDLDQAKREIKLDIDGAPGSVSVYYDAPWRCRDNSRDCCDDRRRFYSVKYDIDVSVPRGARAVLSTVNDGDVHLDQIDNDFDIKNVNGAIVMRGVSGSGDAHTVNGSITAHFATNPAKASSFKSVNGSLDVYFRPGLSADLRFKTFNGGVYTDFEVTPEAVVAAETEHHNGQFVYRSNRAGAARIGNGGPELAFDTLNGSIRIHREQ